MLRSEKWKLLRNWIEFIKNTGGENPCLFESDISFESETKVLEATFYIIDLYLIKKYKGYITEENGVLNINEDNYLNNIFIIMLL